MFTIYGGKTEFNQWEQGHRVTNPKLAVGDKVRFWNASGETHPMIAYLHEGVVVADVPNDLLQHYSPILVELCGDPECLTRFIVNAQDKPKDYVFIDNTHCAPVTPSGSGGVSSWNDLTDKPFYKEQGETLCVSETTITVSDPQEPVPVDTISVENDAKYKVIFDGTAYICTADAVNDYVGNMSFLDPTSFENTGEPFLIMTHNGSTLVFASEAGEHIFSVYTYSETIHRIDPEYLPEGYPYKAGEKHIIRWDGNPEGKVNVGDELFTKVSDLTPSVDELKPLFISGIGAYEDGEPNEEYDDISQIIEWVFSADDVKATVPFAIVYKDNAVVEVEGTTFVFPEKGIYFGNNWHYGRTGYMQWGKETIHPMAPEFLPAGVGGNDREFIVDVTLDYHGQYSGNKTYEEMMAAVQAGKCLVACLITPDGYVSKSVAWGVVSNGDISVIGFRFFTLDAERVVGCRSNDNDWRENG